MARRPRVHFPGALCHVISRGNQRQKIYKDDPDYQRFEALLGRIRDRRATDPKAALAALFEILQRIRHKREHGFKTPEGPRFDDILKAAVSVLDRLLSIAVTKTCVATQKERAGGRS
jgi:hypothetical protein